MKLNLFIAVLFLLPYTMQAQQGDDIKKKYIATSEKEMYSLLEQMLNASLPTKAEIVRRVCQVRYREIIISQKDK